jgi:hypothetical protein
MREKGVRSGECPLCLLERALVRSHLIPQAIYDYFRSRDGASPVRVGNGVIMHTDRQIQDYLLCSGCEHILNEGGEKWVNPKLATMEKTFPLYDLLMNSDAAFADVNGGIYYAAANPKLSVEKLTHFALGIFWKAGVHSWSGTTKEPMIDLGQYAATIRTWLRRETGFPKDVTLTITFSKPETALIVLQQPVEIKGVPWRRYRFYVPGVMFSLNVGPAIELEMRMICFHQMPAHPVFVSNEITAKFNERLGKDYVESRKTKGYLKQREKRQKGP